MRNETDQAPLEELLRLSALGDQVAFAALYDRIASRVHGTTLRVVVDPARAEDVTQEIFVEVWRRCGSFDPGRGSASEWITSIAHRRAVERVRPLAATGQRGSPRHRAPRPSALDDLPMPQRRALELAYFGGHTHTEIATILTMEPGATEALLTRALGSLKKAMGT